MSQQINDDLVKENASLKAQLQEEAEEARHLRIWLPKEERVAPSLGANGTILGPLGGRVGTNGRIGSEG